MLRPLMANSHPSRNPPPPTGPTRAITKPRKVSAACLACKHRKTKCSGNNPCDQCGARDSKCVYDLAADQRRKIANRRNIQELAQKGEDIERLCVVLGGILATVRAGNRETLDGLTAAIRSMTGIPDLSSYVNGLMGTWPEIYLEFQGIDFYLDDAPRRPSVEMIEAMDSCSSSSAATEISPDREGTRAVKGPDSAAGNQQVHLDEHGSKVSMVEPRSSKENMNTREQTGGGMVKGGVDRYAGSGGHSRSTSASDPGSARSSRTARPWEIP